MTQSPAGTYENDILGNRTWLNRFTESTGKRYTWDAINRLASACNTTNGASYKYRADGMRIRKVEGLTLQWDVDDEETGSGHYDENQSTNKPTTRYFYDGQMQHEVDYTYTESNVIKKEITRYGLGARGIDFIEKVTTHPTTTTVKAFPLYDGHGNMAWTLQRSGTNSYTANDGRVYGARGQIQSGNQTGDPKGRYVANFGHVQDDESGLTYMSARYYEPSTGKFINQDPARDGVNWFVYAHSNPTNLIDFSGKLAGTFVALLAGLLFSAAFVVGPVGWLCAWCHLLAARHSGVRMKEPYLAQ